MGVREACSTRPHGQRPCVDSARLASRSPPPCRMNSPGPLSPSPNLLRSVATRSSGASPYCGCGELLEPEPRSLGAPLLHAEGSRSAGRLVMFPQPRRRFRGRAQGGDAGRGRRCWSASTSRVAASSHRWRGSGRRALARSTSAPEAQGQAGSEGLFDPALKRALPEHPRTVGIVHFARCAALRDVLTRSRGATLYVAVIVYPPRCRAKAPRDALPRCWRLQTRARMRFLLLVRGGGSIEDLWSFNDEAVARAIRASTIPASSASATRATSPSPDFAALTSAAPTPTARPSSPRPQPSSC